MLKRSKVSKANVFCLKSTFDVTINKILSLTHLTPLTHLTSKKNDNRAASQMATLAIPEGNMENG